MFRMTLAAASTFCLLSVADASSCDLPDGYSKTSEAYFDWALELIESEENSADCFRHAAEMGHKTAQFYLAGLYLQGKGVTENPELAVFWFRRAASDGGFYDGRAAEALAKLYLAGRGVEMSIAEYIKWSEIGENRKSAYAAEISVLAANAKQGDIEAKGRLGFKYLVGEIPGEEVTVTTTRKGIALLREAAIGGDNGSLAILAGAHRAGRWVPKNPYRAIQWLKVGAKRGDAGSQYALGQMYLNGEGVEINHAVAYVWFNLAASSSDDSFRHAAAEWRDLIYGFLTPDEREEVAETSSAIWEMWPPSAIPPPPNAEELQRTSNAVNR